MPILEPPFPEQMRDAFCRLLEDVPAEEVLRFAKVEKSLLQGARLAPASVPVIRGNIRKVLRSPKTLPPSFRDFLIFNSLQQRVVCVLSPSALKVALPDLEVYFHGRHLIVALLLDEREEVQRLGLERMEAGALDRPAPTSQERAEAAERLALNFKWFLGEMHELVVSAGEDSEHIPAELIAERDALVKQVGDLTRTLTQERNQASKAREAMEGKLATGEELRAKLQKQLEHAKQNAEAVDVAKRAAEDEATELRQNVEERVREGVRRELDARVRPWIAPAEERAAKAEQAASDGAELLARVERALKQQQEHDQHHGNRATLERRLQEFEQAQERVEAARQHALQPLPGLDALSIELRREIVRIQQMLERPMRSDTYDDLLARINAVSTPEALTTLREFVEQGAELGVWDRAHLRALYLKIDHKFSLLLDTFVDHNKAASLRRHPLALVRRAMAGEACCRVYVDGHNLMHVVYEEHFARGGKESDARHRLCEELVRVFADGADTCTRLYFDGPQWSESALSQQIQCIYSGGKGEHRADNAILEDVSGLFNTAPDALCIVVSNDKDLLSQAGLRGALPMRSMEFAALLG